MNKAVRFFLIIIAIFYAHSFAAAPAKSQKPSLLISNASESSVASEIKSAWFAALADRYLQMRFGIMEEYNMISEEDAKKAGASANRYGLAAKEKMIFKGATILNASHIVIHSYIASEKEKNISYYLELLSAKDKSVLFTFDETFPFDSLRAKLRFCSNGIIKAMDLKLSPNSNLNKSKRILSDDSELLIQYGRLAARGTGITEDLKALLDRDPSFSLAYRDLAIEYEKQEKYVHAATAYNNTLLRNSLYSEAIFAPTIKNFRLTGKFNKVNELLKTAASKNISSLALDVEQALLYVDQNKRSEAKALFASILKKDPNQPEGILFTADELIRSKNYSQALLKLEKLIAKKELLKDAYYLKTVALNSLKKYDTALQAALEALKLDKGNSEVSIIAADIYYLKKNYKEAADLYYPVLSKEADNLKTLLKAADAIEKSGDKAKALRLLNNQRKKFGADNKFLIAAGLLEFDLKDSTNALKDLELGKSIQPANGQVFKIIGDIYMSKNNLPKAIAMYEKARPLIKEKEIVDFSLALLYIKNKQTSKAKAKLLTVLANNPSLKEANKHMADVCFQLKEYKSALVYYKKERQYHGATSHIQKQIAEIHHMRKEWIPAIEEWTAYLKLEPKDQKTYLNLVDIFFIQQNSSKAADYLYQAEAFGKVDPELFLKLAKLQNSKKDYSGAIKTYRNYLKKNPSDTPSIIELSKVYKSAGRDSLAAETYLKIYSVDQVKYSSYLANAGHEFYKLKLKNKAEEIYNKFLARNFKDEKVNVNLAEMVFAKKDYKRTTDLLSTISPALKAKDDVIEMLAISYYNLKDYKSAIPFLSKYIQKKSTDASVIEMNAIAYDKLNDYTNAANMYARFLATPATSKHKEYAYHLTELYIKIKFFSKAEELYRKNITVYPDDIRNYEDLSKRLLKKKDTAGALQILEMAAKSSKPTPQMLKTLADIYYSKKSNTQAMLTYKKYLDISPRDTTSWFRLGELQFKSKQYTEALKTLKTANAMMPKNKEVWFMLGASQFHTNDNRSAANTLEKALKMDPKRLETLNYLNKTYTSLEDTNSLIIILEQEIALTKDKLSLHKRLAEILIKKNRMQNAAPHLEAALLLTPKDMGMRKRAIQIFIRMKNGDKCIYHLNQGIKYYPQNAWFYFEKGKCLSLMGKETQAIDEFNRTLALDKKNFRAYYFLGKIYRKSAKFNLAYDNFKKASKLNPKNTKYLYHLAEAAYYTGKLSEASKTVSRIIKVEPENLEFLKLAGNIYVKSKQPAKAETVYEKAISIDNQCGLCHTVLGRINFNNKKYYNAVKHLKHPSSISSADGAHFLMLAKSLTYLKRGNDALEFYLKAMIAEPDNNEAYFLTIDAYMNNGKIEEVISLGGKNLNRAEDRWSLMAKGLYYEAKRQHPEAIKTYQKLLKLRANDPDALTGTGRVYLKMNKFNDALQEFGKAMVGKPEDPEIFALMAEAYFDLNNTEAAEELAQEVLRKNPGQIGANRIMGMIYAQKKQHDLAISALERATSIENINCDLQYILGKEYLSQMQYESSIGSLSRALECTSGQKELEILKMLGDICYFKLHKKEMAKKYYQLYIEAGGDNPKIKTMIQQL